MVSSPSFRAKTEGVMEEEMLVVVGMLAVATITWLATQRWQI